MGRRAYIYTKIELDLMLKSAFVGSGASLARVSNEWGGAVTEKSFFRVNHIEAAASIKTWFGCAIPLCAFLSHPALPMRSGRWRWIGSSLAS